MSAIGSLLARLSKSVFLSQVVNPLSLSPESNDGLSAVHKFLDSVPISQGILETLKL